MKNACYFTYSSKVQHISAHCCSGYFNTIKQKKFNKKNVITFMVVLKTFQHSLVCLYKVHQMSVIMKKSIYFTYWLFNMITFLVSALNSAISINHREQKLYYKNFRSKLYKSYHSVNLLMHPHVYTLMHWYLPLTHSMHLFI